MKRPCQVGALAPLERRPQGAHPPLPVVSIVRPLLSVAGRIRPAITSSQPARAASHPKDRSERGGGAQRLDSPLAEATSLTRCPHRFPPSLSIPRRVDSPPVSVSPTSCGASEWAQPAAAGAVPGVESAQSLARRARCLILLFALDSRRACSPAQGKIRNGGAAPSVLRLCQAATGYGRACSSNSTPQQYPVRRPSRSDPASRRAAAGGRLRPAPPQIRFVAPHPEENACQPPSQSDDGDLLTPSVRDRPGPSA